MPTTIRFGFRNIFDTATLSASPALLTTLPVTNLQKQERNKTARSSSLANQTVFASWPTAQRVNYVHLRSHNHTELATWLFETWTDSAWSTGNVSSGGSTMFPYTGFARNDVLTETDFRLLKNSTLYVGLTTTTKSADIFMVDGTPANPDGYFDMSRIFGGEYYEMAYHAPFGGAQLVYDDASTQSRMDDGSLVSDKRFKFRRIDLAAEFCTVADWAELLAAYRYCGKDKDIFVSLYPGNGTYLEAYHQGLFKFADMSAFDRYFPGMAKTKLTLIET